MRKGLLLLFTVWVLSALFVVPEADAQCAMCRATLENNVSNGETGIAAGINFGIMYLFVTPYIALGLVAFLWYRKTKKRKVAKYGRV